MSLSEDLDTWVGYEEDYADPTGYLEDEIAPASTGAAEEAWELEGAWEAERVDDEAEEPAGPTGEEAADLLGELLAEGFGDDPEAGDDPGAAATR